MDIFTIQYNIQKPPTWPHPKDPTRYTKAPSHVGPSNLPSTLPSEITNLVPSVCNQSTIQQACLLKPLLYSFQKPTTISSRILLIICQKPTTVPSKTHHYTPATATTIPSKSLHYTPPKTTTIPLQKPQLYPHYPTK